MTIGETIRKLRKERTLTQTQIADLLGITYQAVSNWEHNKNAPDLTQIPRLAQIFGVTTDYLLGLERPDKK